MIPLSNARLYAFVDLGCLQGRSPEAVAAELCEGGADLIQLRAKDQPEQRVRELAARLLPVVTPAGVGLVINDRPDIAWGVGAPFCHLGQEDFFDAGYTHVSQLWRGGGAGEPARLPPAAGLSTHAPAQAARAVAAGAAYLAIGPVFATPTKPAAAPVTLEYVRWAAAHLDLPWFAIGGITLENLDAVLDAGARRVCVVSAILRAPDIAAACRAFKERIVARPLR